MTKNDLEDIKNYKFPKLLKIIYIHALISKHHSAISLTLAVWFVKIIIYYVLM